MKLPVAVEPIYGDLSCQCTYTIERPSIPGTEIKSIGRSLSALPYHSRGRHAACSSRVSRICVHKLDDSRHHAKPHYMHTRVDGATLLRRATAERASERAGITRSYSLSW